MVLGVDGLVEDFDTFLIELEFFSVNLDTLVFVVLVGHLQLLEDLV